MQETFVPQNTLLEPNNVITSWEHGGQENKEVSGTLRRIRQKYDNIHKEVIAKTALLEEKKKELDQVKLDESNISEQCSRMSDGLQHTEESLKMVERRHSFALLDQRTYVHMIARMRADLIASKIKMNEMQESYKSKKQIFEEEADKNRQAKQQKLKAQHRFEELMRMIDQDHAQRKNRLASVLKSIDNKKAALERRKKRMERQQQIRDKAANENKDSNELKLNEAFLVQRFWSAYLKQKMKKEMIRTQEIERAFRTISQNTGSSDVQEIVSKFMTRENTYAQLLQTVAVNEEKIDRLRGENEKWLITLNEL